MPHERNRTSIAQLAAQRLYYRDETEYFHAKRKAAKQLRLDHRPQDLPSNREIREHLRAFALLVEGDACRDDLRHMRLQALRFMKMLEPLRPALIGSVLTGHIRQGSDIDIHVFADRVASVTQHLDIHRFDYVVERKRVRKHGVERQFTHIHIHHRFPVELTVYAKRFISHRFRSSITGKAIERATLPQLEEILQQQYPTIDMESLAFEEGEIEADYELYYQLLSPLAEVKQNPRYHPEGDALYHSLQVFEGARQERFYDHEFILAALLHDVGKGIDPGDHTTAALQALEGSISQRTSRLIEKHMVMHAFLDGELRSSEMRKIRSWDDYEDLLLLAKLDRAGRVPGAEVVSLDEAIGYLLELEAETFWD